MNKPNRLDLTGERLTALPESTSQLTGLEELGLGKNQLAALPESIGRLAHLKKLDLYSNVLTALPEALWGLRELQSLNLAENRLVVISCLDNLIKGAGGQAVQNMNVMMGWPETTGLESLGIYP